MTDKVSSHRRFLKKAEHDLEKLFDNEEYASFIGRFSQYAKHADPEIELVEKYYESRLRTDDAGAIVDDALMSMNEGAGNYETHMYYLLTALIELGRYFEVIEFSDHLMAENIPQGFRIEVAALRHRAKKALDEKQEESGRGNEPVVTADDFRAMLHYEKLEHLAQWTDGQDAEYMDLVRDALFKTEDYQLITFMLLYLNGTGDDRPVEIEKFNEKITVVPADLDTLETLELSRIVLSSVLSEMEERMPEFQESARAMVMSHIIHCYPLTPDINTDSLIDSYLLILHEMVNLVYERESFAAEEAMEWIRSMESSIEAGN